MIAIVEGEIGDVEVVEVEIVDATAPAGIE
jgi:hypothetical protein